MANPVFPDIQKPNDVYDENPEEPGMASNMDDGSVISRAKFTKSRMTFKLTWGAMPAADKAALMSFYRNTVKGVSVVCDWVHPDATSEFYGQTFHVRIRDKSFEKATHNRWAVSLTLEEA